MKQSRQNDRKTAIEPLDPNRKCRRNGHCGNNKVKILTVMRSALLTVSAIPRAALQMLCERLHIITNVTRLLDNYAIKLCTYYKRLLLQQLRWNPTCTSNLAARQHRRHRQRDVIAAVSRHHLNTNRQPLAAKAHRHLSDRAASGVESAGEPEIEG